MYRSDIYFFTSIIVYIIETILISTGILVDNDNYATKVLMAVLLAPFVYIPLGKYLGFYVSRRDS